MTHKFFPKAANYLLLFSIYFSGCSRVELAGSEQSTNDISVISELTNNLVIEFNEQLNLLDGGYGISALFLETEVLNGSVAFRETNSEGKPDLILVDFGDDGANPVIQKTTVANGVGDSIKLLQFTHSSNRVIVAPILQPAGTPNLGLFVEKSQNDWTKHVLDSNGATGNFIDAILDDEDVLHIAYVADQDSSLRYLKWSGGNILPPYIELVDTPKGGSRVGFGVSIAISTSGNPIISYYDSLHGQLRIAMRDSTNNTWDSVVIGYQIRQYPLDLDSEGVAKIDSHWIQDKSQTTIYQDGNIIPEVEYDFISTEQLKIHTATISSKYLIDYISPISLDYGKWSKLLALPSGELLLSFVDDRLSRIMFATLENISHFQDWNIEVVDQEGIIGGSHDIFSTPISDTDGVFQGYIYGVVYQDAGNGDLMVSRHLENSWAKRRIQSKGFVGFEPSVSVFNNLNVATIHREHRPDMGLSGNVQMSLFSLRF